MSTINVDTLRTKAGASPVLVSEIAKVSDISIQPVATTPAVLVTNSTLTWALTSNTNLRVSVRGSDGVTRVANLTLA